MKNSYLFPSYFKKIGWIILPFFLALSVYVLFTDQRWELNVKLFALFADKAENGSHWFQVVTGNILDELAITGMTVALLFIAFAREREEDEYISRLRVESLVWAMILNYIILVVVSWLVYGFPFLTVMAINMFTVLILFVVKFNIALYKFKRMSGNEE